MEDSREQLVNEAAYRRTKDWIKKNYPAGQFVGISGGQIVADAANFRELQSALRAMSINPTNTLIVQAGEEYPDYAIILFSP